MSGSEENEPVPADDTEILEEGDRSAEEPVTRDATDIVPMSVTPNEADLKSSPNSRQRSVRRSESPSAAVARMVTVGIGRSEGAR
jgi:hypothetical protein